MPATWLGVTILEKKRSSQAKFCLRKRKTLPVSESYEVLYVQSHDGNAGTVSSGTTSYVFGSQEKAGFDTSTCVGPFEPLWEPTISEKVTYHQRQRISSAIDHRAAGVLRLMF